MADSLEAIAEEHNLLKVAPFRDENGVIFSFRISTEKTKALEKIVGLLKDYYKRISDSADQSPDYQTPKQIKIRPSDPAKSKRTNPNEITYLLKGEYSYPIIRSGREIKQKSHEAIIGFFTILQLTNEEYLTYALTFAMRDRSLGGKFKNNIDRNLTQMEAMGFYEYVNINLRQPQNSYLPPR